MIDIWHYSRYFGGRVNRAARINQWRIGAHAVVAAGVSASLLGFLPSWAALPGNIIVVVFSVYSLVHDYSQHLATLRYISDECDTIKTRVRSLWADVENSRVNTEEAHRRWRELEREIDRVTSKDQAPLDDKLSREAEEAAIEIVKEETAVQV
ncbi:MAG: hypothetical protein OXH96_10670 [Spirochaetaceae bacterium]|nr:hypothetical protein [Spirochaetaceae bacterium]